MLHKAIRSLVVTLSALITLFTVQAQVPGEDWTRIALLGLNTRSLAISPRFSQGDGTLWAGTKGSGVWFSNNYGASWTQSTGTDSFELRTVTDLVVSPNFGNDGIVIAITADGRIYRSVNGGVDFTQVLNVTGGAQGTCLGISANFVGDGKAWAGFNPGGLY